MYLCILDRFSSEALSIQGFRLSKCLYAANSGRTKEENQKLEEIQASLSAETLEGLRQEATQFIAQEYGKVEFGEQTLIRLKMEELIRERYV